MSYKSLAVKEKENMPTQSSKLCITGVLAFSDNKVFMLSVITSSEIKTFSKLDVKGVIYMDSICLTGVFALCGLSIFSAHMFFLFIKNFWQQDFWNISSICISFQWHSKANVLVSHGLR